MAREIRVPITHSVLKWAMAESGFDHGAFADEMGVPPSVVVGWLSGADAPSLGQFRGIARVLRRPTATFLLPAPPVENRPPVAFRQSPGEPARPLNTGERHRIHEVARLQGIVGWLADQLGDDLCPLPD